MTVAFAGGGCRLVRDLPQPSRDRSFLAGAMAPYAEDPRYWRPWSQDGPAMHLKMTPELVLRAYAAGVFPMAENAADPEVFWVDPELRGVLPLDRFHIPKRLERTWRRQPFSLHVNRAFDAVVAACAEPRPGHPETWINRPIREVYSALHRRGYAHSVECWSGDELVGGLYGVSINAAFFGESMFSRRTDASKIALVFLVERLRERNFLLLDTQFVTEHLRQFGAVEISRAAYQRQLAHALARPARFL